MERQTGRKPALFRASASLLPQTSSYFPKLFFFQLERAAGYSQSVEALKAVCVEEIVTLFVF